MVWKPKIIRWISKCDLSVSYIRQFGGLKIYTHSLYLHWTIDLVVVVSLCYLWIMSWQFKQYYVAISCLISHSTLLCFRIADRMHYYSTFLWNVLWLELANVIASKLVILMFECSMSKSFIILLVIPFCYQYSIYISRKTCPIWWLLNFTHPTVYNLQCCCRMLNCSFCAHFWHSIVCYNYFPCWISVLNAIILIIGQPGWSSWYTYSEFTCLQIYNLLLHQCPNHCAGFLNWRLIY